MAKGNLFLGTAHGSVGDATMYRRNGKQVSRVRIRKIGNPRTEAQAKNRAVLATIGCAYSYMQGIVDHSFQGLNTKSENMQKFMKLNQGICRALDGAPSFTAQQYNYNFKGESLLRPNPYAIARGTLPTVKVNAPAEGDLDAGFVVAAFSDNELLSDTTTYNQICAALGVELGTQMTFCIISDDNFTGDPTSENMPASYGNFHFARVILAPDDGDGSKAFFTTPGADHIMNIANANSANQGTVQFNSGDEYFIVNGHKYPLAAGVIVSNYNGRWLRSNCDMVVAADYVYSNGMAEVFNSYMNAEGQQPASDLYLNQSEAPASAVDTPNVLVGVKASSATPEWVTPVEGVYNVSPDPIFVVKNSPTIVKVDDVEKGYWMTREDGNVKLYFRDGVSDGAHEVTIDNLTIRINSQS